MDSDVTPKRHSRAAALLALIAFILLMIAVMGAFAFGITALVSVVTGGNNSGWGMVGIVAIVAAVGALLRWSGRRFDTAIIASAPVGKGDERQNSLTYKANSFATEALLIYGLVAFGVATFFPEILPPAQTAVQGFAAGLFVVLFAARWIAAWYLSRKG